MGCNVCRCSEENIEELLEDLGSASHGVMCLQEVSSWREGAEFNVKGWSVYRNADSSWAVVIPAELAWGHASLVRNSMHALADTLRYYRCGLVIHA